MRTQFSKIVLAATFGLALAFTFSCSSDDGGGGNSSDSGGGSSPPSGGICNYGDSGINGRNGKGNDIANYKTVEIGNQVWMAENLNYNVSGSKCGGNDCKLYDENTINCDKYGRLYDWATAMGIDTKYNSEKWEGSDTKHQGICPNGWHLPSYAEWRKLIDFVGGDETAGAKLKATSGWNASEGKSGNGTDDFGFSALPGGSGHSSGSFIYVGNSGFWWTATEDTANTACRRYMSYIVANVDCNGATVKAGLFSVRCVQD